MVPQRTRASRLVGPVGRSADAGVSASRGEARGDRPVHPWWPSRGARRRGSRRRRCRSGRVRPVRAQAGSGMVSVLCQLSPNDTSECHRFVAAIVAPVAKGGCRTHGRASGDAPGECCSTVTRPAPPTGVRQGRCASCPRSATRTGTAAQGRGRTGGERGRIARMAGSAVMSGAVLPAGVGRA